MYEFFQGKYASRKRAIAQLDAVLLKGIATLRDTYDSKVKGWPYVVPGGTPVSSPSTISMISLAIIQWALVAQFDDLSKEQAKDAEELRKNVVDLAVESLGVIRDSQKKQLKLKSGSFGNNAPFTLVWIAAFNDCLARLRQRLPGLSIPDDNPKWQAFFPLVIPELRSRLTNPMEDHLELDPDVAEIPHAFPRLATVLAAKYLSDPPKGSNYILKVDAHKCRKLFSAKREQYRKHFEERLLRQIAFHAIPDGPFDAAELTFSLEGLLECSALPTDHDPDLIETVFRIISSRQENNPYWRPLTPFVVTPQGFSLLPISVEIANSLLRICNLLGDSSQPRNYFARHVPLFERYREWLASRLISGVKSAAGKSLTGWHSEHADTPDTIHPWETSQVIIFLCRLRSRLQDELAHECLRAVNLSPTPSKVPRDATKTLAEVWEADHKAKKEPLARILNHRCHTVIGDRMIAARDPGGTSPMYSALLYGPPGTGKTAIANDVAATLGWATIEITPSDFVANGEAEVEMRAKCIFMALLEQNHCVVILDEIDRLILDRDSPLYAKQSDMFQFMTPGMLPKLKKLRERQGVIFFIGTNYAERIDSAAVRKGRIDQRILVSPPDKAARRKILDGRLKDKKLNPKGKIADPATILDVIAEKTALSTYGELSQLVEDAVANTAVSATNVTMTDFESAIDAQGSKEISLFAYRSRFKIGDESRWRDSVGREPRDEFILLLSLRAEDASPLSPDEEKLINEVINSLRPEGSNASLDDLDAVEKLLTSHKLNTFATPEAMQRVVAIRKKFTVPAGVGS